MSKTSISIIIFLAAASLQPAAAQLYLGEPDNGGKPCRTSTLLDDEWQFTLLPAPGVTAVTDTVDLPHDWSICHDFDRNAAPGNDGGYLPAGKGIYRKTINITGDPSRHYSLMLEGAYMNATVKVNGAVAGTRPYGYSSVIYDITRLLHRGDNNLEIEVDNSQQKNCRWYSGSGLYRHVRLIESADLHVTPWSVYITTPAIAGKSAEVDVAFSVANSSEFHREATATVILKAPDGKEIATTNLPVKLAPLAESSVAGTLTVADPHLWSPASPDLYTATVELSEDGLHLTDSITETFGIRHIDFSTEGFRLNGIPMTINGGCVHHDNGVVGARSYDAAERRKVALLKQAGFNAVRTSHNPPAPAFLDECDRQGLLVIDEAFDGWRDKKTDHDYAADFGQWWQRDIESMVLRDRNHPSIICWSIGNEIIERKKAEAVATADSLASLCRALDPSRPVTSALASWDSDWEIYDPLAAQHDIVGYNYMIHKAESDHERVPERIMWQTESYPRDAFANHRMVADHSYIIGDFVWTAIDYLGESGIGRHYYKGQTEGEHYHRDQWPWHGAYCGDIDLTGLRKPISHYREMLYNPYKMLYMAVREPNGYNGQIKETQWGVYPTWRSWNWRGHEGKPIEVEVYSRYPKVRLKLDDKVIGEKEVSEETEFKAIFTLPYHPGILRAEGLDEKGSVMETRKITTAGTPVGMSLTADKSTMIADNQDLTFVVIDLVDAAGNPVPDNDQPLHFSVKGPATIIATGNADLTDTSGYCHTDRKTWKGRAIVVLKSTHEPGRIILRVTTPALYSAGIVLESVAAD